MLLAMLFLAFLLLVAYWYISKPKNLPPGPNGFPLIGCIPHQLWNSKRIGEYFTELGKIYGNVVCVRIGFDYLILLNDYETVKEAFAIQGTPFGGRGLPLITQALTHGKGIFTNEGPQHREHRRFILHALRDLGFGRISNEDHINKEVVDFCQTLRSQNGAPFHVTHALGQSVLGNIVHILFGCKLSKKDVDFILERLERFVNVPARAILANSNRFLRLLCRTKLFSWLFGVLQLIDMRRPLENYVRELIKKHHATHINNEEQPDFLHAYIEEQRKHLDKEDSFWWDDEQLVHANVELLLAGTDTTKLSIMWAFLCMATHPELQEQVAKEIANVLGERAPSTRDQIEMPLSEAFVLETLRFSSLSPGGVPHSMLGEAKLYGYHIPKGCIVMPNLYGIAYDKKTWRNADHFDPRDNFIDPETKKVINREKFIPFSLGRRSCVGESLARMELFLYVVGTVQKFRIALPQGVTPTLEATKGIFRGPPIATFIFLPRN